MISKSIHILSVCKDANSLNQPVLGGLNDQNTVLQLCNYVHSQLHYAEVSLKLQFYILKQPSQLPFPSSTTDHHVNNNTHDS